MFTVFSIAPPKTSVDSFWMVHNSPAGISDLSAHKNCSLQIALAEKDLHLFQPNIYRPYIPGTKDVNLRRHRLAVQSQSRRLILAAYR